MNATKDAYGTTYHRDGTVTLWNVYEQQWQRLDVNAISDRVLASLSESERARIQRMADKR